MAEAAELPATAVAAWKISIQQTHVLHRLAALEPKSFGDTGPGKSRGASPATPRVKADRSC